MRALAFAVLFLSALPVRPTPRSLNNEDSEEATLEAAVLTTVAAHRKELKVCADRDTTSEVSKFVLVWDVAANGSSVNIGVSDEAFATHPVSMCVAELVAKLRFPRELSKIKTVSMPFRFGQPRDAGVPTTELALPVRLPSPKSLESRDMISIIETFAVNSAQLKGCASTGDVPRDNPFQLIWDVDANGAATNVGIDKKELTQNSVVICMASALKTWRFPPQFSARQRLSFAFVFRSHSDAGDDFDSLFGGLNRSAH